MPLPSHGDQKYQSSTLVGHAAEWDALRVERRQIGSGSQTGLTSECTELVHILSGVARVKRKGDGRSQEGIAHPGTNWLVPAGTHETLLELDGSTECLHIFVPATLLDYSALADHGLNADAIQLSYVGGFFDPVLAHLATSLRTMLGREAEPTDGIFAEGMRTALAARLIGHYTVDRWRPSVKARSLDPKRLQRVLDLIEARFSHSLSLADLASEACLSPFHFSRLFRDATGRSPHRYVVERRIGAAKKLLTSTHSSLAKIALDIGFESQANFTRAFRKITGLTPRTYRELASR